MCTDFRGETVVGTTEADDGEEGLVRVQQTSVGVSHRTWCCFSCGRSTRGEKYSGGEILPELYVLVVELVLMAHLCVETFRSFPGFRETWMLIVRF